MCCDLKALVQTRISVPERIICLALLCKVWAPWNGFFCSYLQQFYLIIDNLMQNRVNDKNQDLTPDPKTSPITPPVIPDITPLSTMSSKIVFSAIKLYIEYIPKSTEAETRTPMMAPVAKPPLKVFTPAHRCEIRAIKKAKIRQLNAMAHISIGSLTIAAFGVKEPANNIP